MILSDFKVRFETISMFEVSTASAAAAAAAPASLFASVDCFCSDCSLTVAASVCLELTFLLKLYHLYDVHIRACLALTVTFRHSFEVGSIRWPGLSAARHTRTKCTL